MSTYLRSAIEPETMTDITSTPYSPHTGYTCGCHPAPHAPDRLFNMCDYHQGYDAAMAEVRHAAATASLKCE